MNELKQVGYGVVYFRVYGKFHLPCARTRSRRIHIVFCDIFFTSCNSRFFKTQYIYS